MGTVSGDGSESFARGNNIQITNCFDPVTDWPALPKSPIEDFTNGTVYAALSEAAPGIWYLSAETEGHPVLYETEFPGTPTAITEIGNGKVNTEDAVYDLQGRRISTLKKGLYIINGRKVIK